MSNPRLMMRLLTAVYWFDEGLQAALKEAGVPNVTRAQSLLIANISSGVNRASRIAKNLGVTPQAVGQMLNELQARGVVEIVPDPADARARIVRLVGPADRSFRAAARTLDYLELELAQRIGMAHYNALRDALNKDWGNPPKAPATLQLEDGEGEDVVSAPQ
ncbi:MarR family transcriptional regulator [Sphingomonas sp. CL5.1]|uniref:MarR family winged helix-turn-helix transcriptional regulator n=1 Tax=Sphingomonas sp. CL5.1 TaxID=2653203 RepID=UPI0015820788|nr:helix-turn-helix domain-containing protein [Sphingomonas sp. CL5.1]QKR99755.1 MarR family transcriptional regulator [Sphingomonas sp. CL5.1]